MAEKGRFAVFVDWKRNLLSRRQLGRPDRRALYQYRLTAAEFNDLEGLLREWLGKLSRFELSQISRLTGFSGLFVLYAAEWWRHRFDGSHWSWDPILRDVGAEPEEWNALQRSECVVRAEVKLSHPADRELSRGWKPTDRGTAVDKCTAFSV